jgi:isopenicillin-N N-acyltransferase like protein
MNPTRLLLVALLFTAAFLRAQETPKPTPAALFGDALQKLAALVEPAPGTPPQALSVLLKVSRADGLPKEMVGRAVDLSWQAPDRLILNAEIGGERYSAGRDGESLWIHAPGKKFGVIGKPGLPRFASEPDVLDDTKLGRWKLPLPREQLLLLPLLCKVEQGANEPLDGVACRVLRATPQPQAIEALKLPAGTLHLWVRPADGLPARLGWSDGKKLFVTVDLRDFKQGLARDRAGWPLVPHPGDKIETVPLGHLVRFLQTAPSVLNNRIPALGPATGERRVVATHGAGRLEMHDGTKVLFLKGTPEEMGAQHGTLLKDEVRNLVDRVLYGVGVGSSFAKARWFFGEIEEATGRFGKFVDPRYTREMDAMASAAGVARAEARLANFFPELFHCSGFAVFGDAAQGRIFHGRVLDYMKGIGLEQNAVVIVHQPDQGHAWANVSYAGFVGSVTAMNARHISIGEMGGRGEGQWDGKPMAQLMREVMEQANTLDEAVEIMRRGPRTCEYYYVIADGKTKRAVGIAATPTKFEVIQPNQAHPQLPHPIKDAVLMSAGDRYEELARRVKGGFGRFDAGSARDLMTRPVCMTSNIHSVLFAPDTLDFWVANADSQNVASHTRYTHYNLAKLLAPPPAAPVVGGGR